MFKLPELQPIQKHNPLYEEVPNLNPSFSLSDHIYDRHGQPINLDPEQISAVELVMQGKSCVITGNAGTGKTTTSQAIFLALLEHHASQLREVSYRIVRSAGDRWEGTSIACVAASNKAVKNMRRKVLSHPRLKEILGEGLNITTVHNLLEYKRSEVYNEEKQKVSMVFIPGRTAANPLEITHLIVEEASMLGAGAGTLWEKLWDALPPSIQIIFLGDICQIPPVGGKPILSYALQSLPVVELKTIHRQALENPIIRQAYNCLKGEPIKTDESSNGEEGVVILTGSQTKISVHKMKSMLNVSLPKFIDMGRYDPYEDMILCPFNVSGKGQLGTEWINAVVANHVAKKEGRHVYEIRTGFNSIYLSIGDRVLVNKVEGVVTAIYSNRSYIGRIPRPPSLTMDYFGTDSSHLDDLPDIEDIGMSYEALSLDDIQEEQQSGGEKEEKGRAASHTVLVQLDDDTEVSLNSSGHFHPQAFSLGYAISIHKAQGSEWPRVLLILHDTHQQMLYRELLYTAMTRAEKQLIILAQEHILRKAAQNPRIKGASLKDKIEFFNSGYLDQKVGLPT